LDINALSLRVVTVAYPLIAISFLVLATALFCKFYFIRRAQWQLACSFVCLFQAIGMGLSSLAISTFPLYPRESVIPWSRLVLSLVAVPLLITAYIVTREVLEYLMARSHVARSDRGGDSARGVHHHPGRIGAHSGR
jgi:hypothetical protein